MANKPGRSSSPYIILGPSLMDRPNKSQVQLRRVEGEGNLHRSSTEAVLHRQSLPSLDHLRPRSPPEETKRPKRKSLMLMEEAWGWLENLGKGRKQHLTQDKAENGNRQLDNLEVKPEEPIQASIVLQVGDKNSPKNKKWTQNDKELHESITEHVTKRKELRVTEKQDRVLELDENFEAKEKLKKLIIQREDDLRTLELKIHTTDGEILDLEMQQAESMSDDEEQFQFWLNELKAEKGFEKDLQMQFWDLKEKVAECKHQLEQCKIKLQGMDLTNTRHSQRQQSKQNAAASVRTRVDRLESVPEEKTDPEISEKDSNENILITGMESKLPCIVVTANEITESQQSSPAELREWWSRWIEAQKTAASREKVMHRSEVTIHLRGTKV
ncbi:hypothetical protein Baya_15287 [Bagarius yarrelli]|uniref:Uncharacterized protein n=1 Tax=Bagarius yarrelli TaxID=175774 RepID=A0A556VB60_BAGYA|nr:hypothetical protein Baya_15287 [Bagarius yarrelli]